MAVGGTIGGGWLCDRLDRRTTQFLMHGLRVLALPMLILFGATGQVGWLLCFVPLYGATIMVGFPPQRARWWLGSLACRPWAGYMETCGSAITWA